MRGLLGGPYAVRGRAALARCAPGQILPGDGLTKSFRAEAAHRVHEGGLQGLIADSQHGDKEDAAAGGGEDPPGEVGPVGVLLQTAARLPMRLSAANFCAYSSSLK